MIVGKGGSGEVLIGGAEWSGPRVGGVYGPVMIAVLC